MLKRVTTLFFFCVISALAQAANPGTISQPLGPVTAVAGTGNTAIQCVFANNGVNVSVNCTSGGTAIYTGSLTPVATPASVTGLLASLTGNGNSISWIITPTAVSGVYNWSITANSTIKTGSL